MFSAIPRRLPFRSVRARLTFWYLLTLGASLSAFAVFVYVVRANALHDELDSALELRVHELSTALRSELFALDVESDLAGNEQAQASELLVTELPGAPIFRSPSFPKLGWQGQAELARAAREGRSLVTVVDNKGADVRIATLIVERPGAATLALQLGMPTEPIGHNLNRLVVAMLFAIGLVLVVASYGSGITARRALAPVDEIVARAKRIQAGRLRDRLDVHAGSAELDRLVATLNDMLDRIETSMHTARRFAADASHELQTPLTAMRGIVEACARKARSVVDYQAMASDLLNEIERCSTLVRDLRLLALAEARQVVVSGERVDLRTLAIDCGEIARAVGEEKQIEVRMHAGSGPVPIAGSALHLRRVILNLTDNAIRYSADGSTIDIHVGALGRCGVVSVADRGCGIDPADLPHIFEPFYRADPARARQTGGTGLGLAIADQIVRAHGGAISVSSLPGLGSTFTMTLPSAPTVD